MNRRSFLKSLVLLPLGLVSAKALPKQVTLQEAVSDNIEVGELELWGVPITSSDINTADFGIEVGEWESRGILATTGTSVIANSNISIGDWVVVRNSGVYAYPGKDNRWHQIM